MNPGCGWCTKSDPHVDALRDKGFKITTLNVSEADEAKRANEVKTKHNIHCGTPLFIDAESGNNVCGFKELDILEKWAKGEKMPTRPMPPQMPPGAPAPTNVQHDENAAQKMMLNRYAARGEVWKEAKYILVDEFYHLLSIWSDNLSDDTEDTCSLSERPIFPTVDQIIEEAEKIHKFNRGFS
tara:strand:+ start:62 stop:610 length:549 start_codon:yes stop_codon:yes gene_type:complete